MTETFSVQDRRSLTPDEFCLGKSQIICDVIENGPIILFTEYSHDIGPIPVFLFSLFWRL